MKFINITLIVLSALVVGSIGHADQVLRVQTNRYGDKLVAAIDVDTRVFYGVVCDRGVVAADSRFAGYLKASSAKFLLPNPDGEITSDDEQLVPHQRNFPRIQESKQIPLSAEAVNEICNKTQGEYVIKIVGIVGQERVELLNTVNQSASTNRTHPRF